MSSLYMLRHKTLPLSLIVYSIIFRDHHNRLLLFGCLQKFHLQICNKASRIRSRFDLLTESFLHRYPSCLRPKSYVYALRLQMSRGDRSFWLLHTTATYLCIIIRHYSKLSTQYFEQLTCLISMYRYSHSPKPTPPWPSQLSKISMPHWPCDPTH
jgi:hypothetical protein